MSWEGMGYLAASLAAAGVLVGSLEWYRRNGFPTMRPRVGMTLIRTARLSLAGRARRAARAWRRGQRVCKPARLCPLHRTVTPGDLVFALQWIGASGWDIWEAPGHLVVCVPRRFVKPLQVILPARTPIGVRIEVERL